MIPSLPEPPLLDFSSTSLFLDFDGTLIELADTPSGVDVSGTLIDLLHALSEVLQNRLALISGRAISVLDGFGLGGMAIAGSHGAEWRLPDGSGHRMDRPPVLDRVRDRLIAFADSDEGLLFEDKPLGAALHYRMAPQRRDEAHALATELAHEYGLHLQHGHDMVELRKAGVNKGTAIAELMQMAPFLGYSPVFAGDDVTDEDGFRAVREAGGMGILVGAVRATAAGQRLGDVRAVNHWLSRSLNAHDDSRINGDVK